MRLMEISKTTSSYIPKPLRDLLREISPNAKWDLIKWSGAAMIGVIAYFVHRFHGLPDWTFGIVIFVVALIVFWWATRSIQTMKTQQNVTPETESQAKTAIVPPAPQPKLTIRIDAAYCGERKSNPSLTLILLHVIVDGPPSTVKKWGLKLVFADEPFFTSCDPIRDAVAFRPEGQDVSELPIEAKQISDKVPHRGWLQFSRLFDKEFRERHIFGAMFSLTAFDADGSESTVDVPPGSWFHKMENISN